MAKKDETEQPVEQTNTGGETTNGAGADQVQAQIDEENEQGFRGVEVDQTPNHAYTVEGVTNGEETPETKEQETK